MEFKILLFLLFTTCFLTDNANHVNHANSNDIQIPHLEIKIGEVTKAQIACTKQYKVRQQEINRLIKELTVECVSTSNQTANATEEKIGNDVMLMRKNLTRIRDSINNCTSIENSLLFVQCIQTDKNFNVDLWIGILQLASFLESQINQEMIIIENIRKNCIDNVIQEGTRNYTQAGMEYTDCMNRVFSPLILY